MVPDAVLIVLGHEVQDDAHLVLANRLGHESGARVGGWGVEALG